MKHSNDSTDPRDARALHTDARILRRTLGKLLGKRATLRANGRFGELAALDATLAELQGQAAAAYLAASKAARDEGNHELAVKLAKFYAEHESAQRSILLANGWSS